MRGRSVLFATTAALLLATLPAAPGATATGPGGGESAPAAERALAEAVALMAPPARRTSARGGGAEADASAEATAEPTLVLRDLRLHYRSLSRADQRTADGLLARPTALEDYEPTVAAYDPGDTPDATCPDLPSADLCVHWVTDEGSRHAPDLTDDNGNTTPDYVDTVAQVMDTVWRNTVDRLGYRAPLSDATSPEQGPDETLDVYLADLGGQFYGYCTSDDPDVTSRQVSAFCVLDNDYAEFGSTQIKNLRATAAHEFFHAVQFAYDIYEDRWLMESTATWVEDEIFDGVDDNRQYLPSSQLRTPWVPMDCIARPNFGCDQNFPYGTWAFWRYLSERTDPAVVRQTWERAGNPGVYSLKAVSGALKARNRSFGSTFADFGRATRFSKRMFSEGRTYPQARPIVRRPVTNAKHRRAAAFALHHLSHDHVEFRTHRSLGRKGKLRLRLDLPFRARGSQVRVTLRLRNGRLPQRRVTLNRKGDDTLVVPFNAGRVKGVVVTFTNASTRMRDCDVSGFGTSWSCGGRSRDDGLDFVFRATPFRG